jgi:CBS domain containing-hemolysin-like protein
LNGALPLHKFAELLSQRLDESGDVTTVSGFITQRLGRFPRPGDVLATATWKLSVNEIAENKAARLTLALLAKVNSRESGTKQDEEAPGHTAPAETQHQMACHTEKGVA